MVPALSVERLGKRFPHHDARRPRTIRQFVEGGWRRFGGKHDFWALRGVEFAVEPGETLGVIGRNGSGKSTLLRMLGGVMRPDEGRVIAKDRISGLLDLNAGMHLDLTGRENAIGTGIIAGLTRRNVIQRMDEVIAFAEIEDFIDEPVRTYSAGMRLRLGFAVAMQTQPRILLIDEVLAVGDIAFQQKCLERINQFRMAGCAIVLISHDLAQVESMCDRVLWLQNGATVSLGATVAVVREYESEMLQETVARTPKHGDLRNGGQTHLVLNSNRFGTLENKITRVRFLDEQGGEVGSIRTGEALSLQIWVDSVIPISDLHLCVTMANEKAIDLLDMTTEEAGVNLPERRGVTMVQLDLGRLDLATGRYHFSVGVYEKNWAFAFDRHVNAYDLDVVGNESWCAFNPPHRWTITNGRI